MTSFKIGLYPKGGVAGREIMRLRAIYFRMHIRKKKWALYFICAVCLLLLLPSVTLAHKVTIFAWVEGGKVHSISKFSSGKRVKNGQITALGARGQKVAVGHTDDQGEFSFDTPFKDALLLVLDAGMGHRAEWRLTKADMGGDLALKYRDDGALQPSANPDGKAQVHKSAEHAGGGVERTILEQALREAIDETIARRLAPLHRELASLKQAAGLWRISAVIGGIGYILGLMGVAAYVHARRNKR